MLRPLFDVVKEARSIRRQLGHKDTFYRVLAAAAPMYAEIVTDADRRAALGQQFRLRQRQRDTAMVAEQEKR